MSLDDFAKSGIEEYRDDEIINIQQELTELGDLHGYPVTFRDVSSDCSFSPSKVERIGSGSFVKGLVELNVPVTDHQVSCSDSVSITEPNVYDDRSAYSFLSDSDVDLDADGYVYNLYASHFDDKYIYVGKVGVGNSLTTRLISHISGNVQTSDVIEFEGSYIQLFDANLNIESVDVYNFYLSDVSSEQQLELRLKYEEREMFRSLSHSSEDFTVIGGR